jgi:hypothetical protein
MSKAVSRLARPRGSGAVPGRPLARPAPGDTYRAGTGRDNRARPAHYKEDIP